MVFFFFFFLDFLWDLGASGWSKVEALIDICETETLSASDYNVSKSYEFLGEINHVYYSSLGGLGLTLLSVKAFLIMVLTGGVVVLVSLAGTATEELPLSSFRIVVGVAGGSCDFYFSNEFLGEMTYYSFSMLVVPSSCLSSWASRGSSCWGSTSSYAVLLGTTTGAALCGTGGLASPGGRITPLAGLTIAPGGPLGRAG